MTTNTQLASVDLVVVGGGIVGLATAYSVLTRFPNKKVVVLEKESTLGAHQTGHNSGVIHSGLYYKPGSQKAKNCLDGYNRILKFCDEFGVPYEVCGKIVVATSEDELGQLEILRQRGEQNGLAGIRRLSSSEIKEYEPHCAGIAGLLVLQTGIVDYSVMTTRLAEHIANLGGQILTNQKVTEISSATNSTILSTSTLEFSAKSVVTCGGLFSDRLAMLTEPKLDLRIVPFRGEYFELKKSAAHLVRFPILNFHFWVFTSLGELMGQLSVVQMPCWRLSARDIEKQIFRFVISVKLWRGQASKKSLENIGVLEWANITGRSVRRRL